jgi:hypothetical protein
MSDLMTPLPSDLRSYALGAMRAAVISFRFRIRQSLPTGRP